MLKIPEIRDKREDLNIRGFCFQLQKGGEDTGKAN